MSGKVIRRVTMFKVPNPADIQMVVDAYKVMAKTAVKDGKPYMLSAVANATVDDPRNQGYTVCAQTTFASLEDMNYYDNECTRN